MSITFSTRASRVITAVNLQHIEEQQDAVERITGKRARQTVPESFLRSADEIVLVDAALDDLQKRAGVLEPADVRRFAELRELALLLAADVIDDQLMTYLRSNRRGAALGHSGAHPGVRDAAQRRSGRCCAAAGATPTAFTATCWSVTCSRSA